MSSQFFSKKSFVRVRFDRLSMFILVSILFVLLLIAAWLYYQPTEVGLPSLANEQQTIEPIVEDKLYIYVGDFLITTYCGCELCNGNYPGLDCQGNPLEIGTIAVDKDLIPLGTTLYFDFNDDGILEKYVARDVGSMINGNHIDVYVETHDECNKKFYTKVYISK